MAARKRKKTRPKKGARETKKKSPARAARSRPAPKGKPRKTKTKGRGRSSPTSGRRARTSRKASPSPRVKGASSKGKPRKTVAPKRAKTPKPSVRKASPSKRRRPTRDPAGELWALIADEFESFETEFRDAFAQSAEELEDEGTVSSDDFALHVYRKFRDNLGRLLDTSVVDERSGLPERAHEELTDLEREGFSWEANRDGTADAMYTVPVEEFIDWADLHGAEMGALGAGFTVYTRVHIRADKKLAEYLKSQGSMFTMSPRNPKAWPMLAHVTLEAIYKIERNGWEPLKVDIIVRFEP